MSASKKVRRGDFNGETLAEKERQRALKNRIKRLGEQERLRVPHSRNDGSNVLSSECEVLYVSDNDLSLFHKACQVSQPFEIKYRTGKARKEPRVDPKNPAEMHEMLTLQFENERKQALQEMLPHNEIEWCSKNEQSKLETNDEKTVSISPPHSFHKAAYHDTIHKLARETELRSREGSKDLDFVLVHRSSQVLYEKLYRGVKLFKTSATAIKDTVDRIFDELDYMEENLRSLQSENHNVSQPFREERLVLLRKIQELEEKVRMDRRKVEKMEVYCKSKDRTIAMLQQRTIRLSAQKRKSFIHLVKLQASLRRKQVGERDKKPKQLKDTEHLCLTWNMAEQVSTKMVTPAKNNWITLLGLACAELEVDECVSYLGKAWQDAMSGNAPRFICAFEFGQEVFGNVIKISKILIETEKPESAALTGRRVIMDQEIQPDTIFEIQIAQLRLLLTQKDKRMEEMEEKIRQCEIDHSTKSRDHRDHMITLEKETIAAEALSALHQTVIHEKPKKVIFADNADCAVNEGLEVDVKSRANSCTSCNSFESSEKEEGRKKFQKVQRPQKRSVRVAYFRWTTDKNLLLVSKMIDVLAEYGKNQLKESDFLHMVWERCGEICSESKIRDNVNNLLRRHLHLSTKPIPEVKSCPEEYARLLEKIRESLENQGSDREKVKESAAADDEVGKTLDISVSGLIEKATGSEKQNEQTLAKLRSINATDPGNSLDHKRYKLDVNGGQNFSTLNHGQKFPGLG